MNPANQVAQNRTEEQAADIRLETDCLHLVSRLEQLLATLVDPELGGPMKSSLCRSKEMMVEVLEFTVDHVDPKADRRRAEGGLLECGNAEPDTQETRCQATQGRREDRTANRVLGIGQRSKRFVQRDVLLLEGEVFRPGTRDRVGRGIQRVPRGLSRALVENLIGRIRGYQY
jgi:hypothetical protein